MNEIRQPAWFTDPPDELDDEHCRECGAELEQRYVDVPPEHVWKKQWKLVCPVCEPEAEDAED